MSADVLLSVRHLSKAFRSRGGPSVLALDDVSLEVRREETLALVGESGSGKTTLGRAVLRLTPVDAGEVRFDGRDVLGASKSELRAFRRDAQIVFQDPFSSLDPRMRVASILREGMHYLGIPRAEMDRRLPELLAMVRLPTSALERYPQEFSGGQRQRISLARALAVTPRFLVADEPVSALDVSVQATVLNLMLELQRELALTYLFISHDMSVVRHVADRVAVMQHGRIVEVGPVADVLERPTHPYTRQLIAAVPSVAARRRARGSAR